VNPELLKVAVDLLNEHGWEALSLDRIAERAGVARVTVWRHGLTRGSVEKVLRHKLIGDYRELVSDAPHHDLAAALHALCEVGERNLPLLAHTETAFHGPDLDAAGIHLDFFGPWLPLLESDGIRDLGEPERFITALTNMVILTYVHLRAYHGSFGWLPANTAEYVVALVSRGYLRASP